jgi:hypothetical protein
MNRSALSLSLSLSLCAALVAASLSTSARATEPAPLLGGYAARAGVPAQDVLGRECTAGEKADLRSWLLTFKP